MVNKDTKILMNNQELDTTLHTQMYDDIIKNERLLEKIIKRWTDFGFLAKLEGDTKTRVAVMYEQMASFLMDENVGYDFSKFIDNMNYKEVCQLSRYHTFNVDKPFEEIFETIIFPIIYRTLPNVDKVVEFDDFMNLFDVIKDDGDFLLNAYKKIEDENKNYDLEAEYCAYISNKLIEKLNEE